jgi:hypothetical protein
MIFSLEELFFLNLFLKYKKNYDYIKNKSHKYKIFLKKDNIIPYITKVKVLDKYSLKEYNFIPLGYINKNKFIWIDGMNKIFENHFLKYNFNKLYLTDKLQNYLFNDNVTLLNKHKYIIPYIISFTNPAYNVVEFNDKNNVKFFGLIDLNIDDNDIEYHNNFLKILDTII